VSEETIDDYFLNRGPEHKAIAAIKKHWNVIWPIFERKIVDGQIELIHHDHGPRMIAGRYQTIRQVTLTPQDFGYRDFRKNA
jgi:hypothetical protein